MATAPHRQAFASFRPQMLRVLLARRGGMLLLPLVSREDQRALCVHSMTGIRRHTRQAMTVGLLGDWQTPEMWAVH